MKRLFAYIILFVTVISVCAQNIKSVTLSPPDNGKYISDFLSEEEMLDVDSLILRGWFYDAERIYSEIRHMCQDGKLKGLDMSNVDIQFISASAFKPRDSEKKTLPLQYITLPKDILFIEDGAFENTALREFFINEFMEGIGKDAV